MPAAKPSTRDPGLEGCFTHSSLKRSLSCRSKKFCTALMQKPPAAVTAVPRCPKAVST
ncbi:hypothetical protein EMIT0158MI4_300019 [Burkholderia ambifaria]